MPPRNTLLTLGMAATALFVACGSTVPKPSPTAAPRTTEADLTPVPGAPSTPVNRPVARGFDLPKPICTVPGADTSIPLIHVAVGDGKPVEAMTGSSTIESCTTTSAGDSVGDPVDTLHAQPGDVLTVSLPAGWILLAWDSIDQPADGVGDHVLPTVATPDHPARATVPVPVRSGVSIVTVTLYVSAANGGAVGQVEARVGVQVGPTGS